MGNMTHVSRQWAIRPSDERFTSMSALHKYTEERKLWSKEKDVHLDQMKPHVLSDQTLGIVGPKGHPALLNHWSFGQLCTISNAPAHYLRNLPAKIAAVPLEWSMRNAGRVDNSALLRQGTDGSVTLRALTSPTYGRIWDVDVVEAVREFLPESDGWKIPAASYATSNPKLATTLYASDRDVFLFLVNEETPIEIDGETLFRGIVISNSEVGSRVLKVETMLYNFVCDNRIIWGVQNFQMIKVKHTKNAPSRYFEEARPALREYAHASAEGVISGIKTARERIIADNEADATAWLRNNGFAKGVAERAVKEAQTGRAAGIVDGVDPFSAWGLLQGITASVRGDVFTDNRLVVEEQAGKLLAKVTRRLQRAPPTDWRGGRASELEE